MPAEVVEVEVEVVVVYRGTASPPRCYAMLCNAMLCYAVQCHAYTMYMCYMAARARVCVLLAQRTLP
jgi:hypothetical protein